MMRSKSLSKLRYSFEIDGRTLGLLRAAALEHSGGCVLSARSGNSRCLNSCHWKDSYPQKSAVKSHFMQNGFLGIIGGTIFHELARIVVFPLHGDSVPHMHPLFPAHADMLLLFDQTPSDSFVRIGHTRPLFPDKNNGRDQHM